MKRRAFILSNYFSVTVFLFACSSMRTHNINISEIGNYPQPLVEPLPLKVGAYYGEDFCKFDTVQQISIPNSDITLVDQIMLGEANTALFDYILSHTFEKVTPFQRFSEDSRHAKDLDIIIEPKVSEYSYSVSPSICQVRIIYAIAFYTPDGARLGPWLIEGNGFILTGISFKTETTLVTELTQMAMRQAAAKFMTGFCDQPEIKQLFYNQCNK